MCKKMLATMIPLPKMWFGNDIEVVCEKDSSLLRMDNFMSGSHNLCLTCGVKLCSHMYFAGGLLAYKVVPLVPLVYTKSS
jgi:hypothetical protein